METFEQPIATNDELLKRFDQKRKQGWKLASRPNNNTWSVVIYVDNQLLYRNGEELITLFLFSSLVSDFFITQGDMIRKYIVISDLKDESISLDELLDVSNRQELSYSRIEKLNLLNEKIKSSGFTLNSMDLRFITELINYQEVLSSSYYWLRFSNGCVLNDVPCLRLKSGNLLPLFRYEEMIFAAGINLSWIGELYNDVESMLIISSKENSIDDVVDVIQSKFKNLFCVPVRNNTGLQLLKDETLFGARLKSRYSISAKLHYSLLRTNFNKAKYSEEKNDLGIIQVGGLLDHSRKSIAFSRSTSGDGNLRNELTSAEVRLISVILAYDLVIRKFMETHIITDIINFLFPLLEAYNNLVDKYDNQLKDFEDDELHHLINGAFYEIAVELLNILGMSEE